MARISKDVVSYFPHDANASTGDTLTVLQSRFGNDGYAFWFKLLEKLSSAEGHYLDCRNSTRWQLLLAKMGVNEITGVEIMNLLVEMHAIDKDLWEAKLIWCQNLVDNLSEVYKNRRREAPLKPMFTKDNRITTDDKPINTGSPPVEIPQSRVEESRVEESRVEEVVGNTFEAYKKKLTVKHPELNIDEEWERCQIWYRDHKKQIKSPSLALGNWCVKEMEIKDKGGTNGADKRHSAQGDPPTKGKRARDIRGPLR